MRWTGRSVVAVVLAIGCAVSLMAAFVGSEFTGDGLSAEAATLLSTAFGAVVGALAAFLGSSADRDMRSRHDDTPDTPPEEGSEL